MINAKNSAVHVLIPVLFLLLCAGCAEKKQPTLFDDPSFMDDLRHSRANGVKGIAVVAPSSGLSEESLRTVVRCAEKAGVSFHPEEVKPGLVPYNANTDKVRLSALEGALNNPDVEVIWAVRGGYGASRLLAGLADVRLPDKRKILIGYSDITFLHLFLHKFGWKTVHGGMFWEFNSPGKEDKNFRLLAALLSGRLKELRYDELKPFNAAARNSAGPISGILTGGNLTCLASAAGTPWFPDGAGKILFLEDVKEPGYKIDRMLTQLRDAGLLKDVGAVLLGEFTNGDEDTEYALARFADEFDRPVFRTDIFGHGRKNYPLILNAPTVIERTAGNRGIFSLIIDAASLDK